MLELPAQQPVTITDPFDVSSFATYLEKSERKRVTVLITANAKNVLPIDPAACHRQADGSADVVVLRDMKIQERFRQRIGERYYTINGGIRIYPADDSWRDAPRHSRYLPSREAFKPQALNVVLGYIKDAERHTRARQSALAERPVTPDSPKPSPIFDHSIDVSTPPQCPPVPDTRIWTISNGGQAKQLIDYLMNPRRDRPVVVLTRAAGQDEPFADRRQLSDHVGDIAAIADIAGTDATCIRCAWVRAATTRCAAPSTARPTGVRRCRSARPAHPFLHPSRRRRHPQQRAHPRRPAQLTPPQSRFLRAAGTRIVSTALMHMAIYAVSALQACRMRRTGML